MKKSILTLVCLILVRIFGLSQDIHFSDFYNAPLILNPANTGNYIGNWRLISNFRKQVYSSNEEYKTTTLAYDMPVYFYRQMGSVGLIFINDNSANNTLLSNRLYLSVSHFIRISSKSYLHMGFQFGYVSKKYSLQNLSFPDQFDMHSGHFNPDLPTQEFTENQKVGYADLNWGLIWSRKTTKHNSEIGIAMFHYNTPNENFSGQSSQLPARYQSHAYFEMKLTNHLFLKPKVLYTLQNKAMEALLGTDLGYFFTNNSMKDIDIGIFYRKSVNKQLDDLIAKAGFHFKNMNFDLSYDFEIPNSNISDFTTNAIELTFSYTRPGTALKNRIIPCETF